MKASELLKRDFSHSVWLTLNFIPNKANIEKNKNVEKIELTFLF